MRFLNRAIHTMIFCCFAFSLYSQTSKIDELKNELEQRNGRSKALVLLDLATNLRGISPMESNQYCFQGLKLLELEKNDSLKICYYNLLSFNYALNLDKSDTALYFNQIAIKLAQETDNKTLLAVSYRFLGLIYWKIDNYFEAILWLEESIRAGEELGLDYEVGLSFNNLGLIYFDIGDYHRALENYFKLLKVSIESVQEIGVGLAYVNVGGVYLKIDSIDIALDYLHKSEHIFIELNNKIYLAQCYQYLAKAYSKQYYFNISRSYFDKSANLMKELHMIEGLATTYMELGNLALLQKEYQNAVTNYSLALKLFNGINNINGSAQTNLNLGKGYKLMNKVAEAKQKFQESIKLAKTIGTKKVLSESYFELADISEKEGKLEESLKYHKLFDAYDDSINSEENKRDLIRLQVKYQIAEKEREIDLLMATQGGQRFKISKQKNIINTFLFIGVLLLVFITLIINLYLAKQKSLKKIERIYAELERKTDEISLQREKLIIQADELFYQSEEYERQNIELEKLSIVASKTNNAIAIYLPDGHIEYMNDKFKSQFRGVLNESDVNFNTIFNFSKQKDIRGIWKKCLDKKETVIFETKNNSVSKIENWTQTTFTPIINNKGAVEKVISIDSDISLLKLAELEKAEINNKLIVQRDELQIANATKDKFFNIIAHDLVAPFHNILGFAKLLQESILNSNYDKDKITRYSNNIYRASNQSFELLSNLLTWSRSQRGVINYKPVILVLKAQIQNTIELLESIAEKKEIEIQFFCETSAQVYVDKEMLATVLRNLISNAIKFSQRNSKIIIESTIKDNTLVTSIMDFGTGMLESDLKRLFRIDEDFHTEGTENEQGTGLGLVLCKEFIDKNKGKIWVESKLNVGTTFYFSFPLNTNSV